MSRLSKIACLLGICMVAVLALEIAQSAPMAARTGYNILTCDAQVLELGENHSLVAFRGRGLVVTAPDSADHMAEVDCLGTIENMPDKTFKASGYCVLTDRDGDKWLDRWWADSTMPKGRWEDTGISGKWKGVRRAGQYVYTDRSSGSACRGISTWEVNP